MLPWSPIENRASLWVYYEVVEDFVFCLHRLWTLADGKSSTSSSCPSIGVSSISEWPRALHLAQSLKCMSSQKVGARPLVWRVTTCVAPRTKSKVRVIPKDGARPSVWQVQSYCIFLAIQWALINFFCEKLLKLHILHNFSCLRIFCFSENGIMVSWYHIF